jgi:hypothetical protein
MPSETTTETYIPVTIMVPRWEVTDVTVAGPLTLQVTFVDGTTGTVRFEASHLTGIFEPLRDPEFFEKVHVDDGAVTWPGEIDLAPDAMYDEIKARGEWALR